MKKNKTMSIEEYIKRSRKLTMQMLEALCFINETPTLVWPILIDISMQIAIDTGVSKESFLKKINETIGVLYDNNTGDKICH